MVSKTEKLLLVTFLLTPLFHSEQRESIMHKKHCHSTLNSLRILNSRHCNTRFNRSACRKILLNKTRCTEPPSAACTPALQPCLHFIFPHLHAAQIGSGRDIKNFHRSAQCTNEVILSQLSWDFKWSRDVRC